MNNAANWFANIRRLNTALLFASIVVISVIACSSSSAEKNDEGVRRILSQTTIKPGMELTITIKPSGIGGFFAIEEAVGDLEIVSNSADSFRDGIFVQLEEQTFDYSVLIPETAHSGDVFTITGEFWSDPASKEVVNPATTLITID